MPKISITNFFIASVLSDSQANLMVYKDPKFVNHLRLTAIDEINVILLKINSDQLYSQSKASEFDLKAEVNIRHPQSGLRLLDYCLVAGFYDLATRLCYSGAVCTNSDIFEANIARTFLSGDQYPEVIQDIQSVLDKLSYIKLSNSSLKLNTTENRSNLEHIKSIAHEHPFSAVLFSVGAICSLASPFAHGYATILLVSVGIPALFSSVNSMQNSKGGKDNRQQVLMHDRIAYEAKEVRHLLEISKEIKHELINAKLQVDIIVPHVVKDEYLTDQPAQQVHFAYESRPVPEIVLRCLEDKKNSMSLVNS